MAKTKAAPVSGDPTTDALHKLAKLYRITFTEKEVELMTTSRGLLDALEKQERYLLENALTQCECPVCTAKVCQRSADPNYDARGSTPDDAYVCPFCNSGIVFHLGVTGQQWFTRKR